MIRNQEAKKVRDIGSLIFETLIQHDYEEGVEVRSLLSSEQLEEMDGRLAVVDVSPSTGARFVKFWVDEIPLQDDNVGEGRREIDPSFAQHAGSRTPSPMEREGWRHQFADLLGQDVQEKVLILEQAWIITIMMSLEGNVFPTTVTSHHLGQGRIAHPQKIRTQGDALCIPWNHYEIGSVRQQT